MAFQIIWSDDARNQMKKLDYSVRKRIFEKVGVLADDPYHFVKKLVGVPYFSLRVGDYRVMLNRGFKICSLLRFNSRKTV